MAGEVCFPEPSAWRLDCTHDVKTLSGLANGTARQYKNHASETTQGLFYYWFVQRRTDSEATYVPRAVYNWQVPADRHDVRSLDGARLAHFTHCGKPPSKVNGRYDACALLHREWRETWARVAAESGVVVGEG